MNLINIIIIWKYQSRKKQIYIFKLARIEHKQNTLKYLEKWRMYMVQKETKKINKK